ncbi:MAG: hypothetical protein HGB17_18055, partial [Syntrophobacteraceae bacterium]|nr:hypothetical protein [Syntrophobacteraceae bacterium]
MHSEGLLDLREVGDKIAVLRLADRDADLIVRRVEGQNPREEGRCDRHRHNQNQ